jgi:hypothetical protein
MGASQSAPVIGLSRETLLKSTQPMRDVADAALRVMLERITPRDLLSLANPAECSKYVMVIGGAFDHFFRSIDVVPVIQGKPPQTIYFQRADVLTGRAGTGSRGMDEMQKAYRQSICKALGYFFMRFFQIFAALALSIFDDANIQTGVYDPYRLLPTGLGYGAPRFGAVFGQTPQGGSTQTPQGGSTQTPSQDGGARTLIQAFKDLFKWDKPETIIKLSGDKSEGYREMRNGNVIGSKYIYYKPESINITGQSRGRLCLVEDDREIMKVSVYFGSSPDNNLFYIRIYDVTKERPVAYSTQGVYLEFEYSPQFDNYYLVKDQGTNSILIKGPRYGFAKAIRTTMLYFWEHNKYESSNKDKFKRTHGRHFGEREEDRYRREYGYKSYETTGQIPEELKPLYKILQEQVRPVAHCISRSLQLINLNVLTATGGQSAYSHICNYKFMDPHPSGLPAPGHSLGESPGMKSMEMLFTVLQNGAVQLTDATRTEYLAFLQAMARIYEDPEHLQEGKLKALINKVDAKTCARIQDTQKAFALTGPEAEVAKRAVMKLWAKQLQHTQQVDKLFAQMFVIDKARQIQIHPNILKFGIPGLDHIAQSARRLLMNYYTTCEAEYQAGIKDIIGIREQARQKIMARLAAPAPAPGPGPLRPGAAPRPPAPGFASRSAVTRRAFRRGGGGGGNSSLHPDAIRLGLVEASAEALRAAAQQR